ncbi:hypothetical protein FOJ82_11375 [Tessaracoccus rhinocerotis]|uniref:Uncharacterized protein n=1 Tax=Tessaracoccus rhinocerotis TaxID=1689449 RepID=A0A553JZI6_9ACTN|nr:ankyrin repeat domain-containing protein [Tessaracoccus rhinocerotis]TRY17859.1 hypothetical protein FOJ82_11375 [Tessaracoccus rhinocerotis]
MDLRPAAAAVLTAALLASCAWAPSAAGPDAGEFFDAPDAVALAEAVAVGDADEVARLVSEGADPDAKGEADLTMLQWAIRVANADGLVSLLDSGADPDLNGVAGRTPLEDTVDVDTTDAVAELMIPLLLEAGADPSGRNTITGEAPLSVACVTSSDAAIGLLVEAGADLDAADFNGSRALHACARVNRGAQLLVLLEAGADPLATLGRGTTFQDFYFGYDRELLNERALAERDAVIAWLEEHDVPVNPEAYA